MPLSEDEQRILTEIEHQLRSSDPDLVRQVGETTVYSLPKRKARLAAVGLLAGLAVTIALLGVNAYLAFAVGFGLMFVSALALERNLRHLVNAGVSQLTATVRASSVRDLLGMGNDPDDADERRDRDEPF